MDLAKKSETNKLIRQYNGNNQFLKSLQHQLKTNKSLKKETLNNKEFKVLSDKQYEVAIKLLENENIN